MLPAAQNTVRDAIRAVPTLTPWASIAVTLVPVRTSTPSRSRSRRARSPFFVIGTTNPDGTGDTSPKGGPAGFVRRLDEHHLAFGELPGNNRIDGFRNIVRDPRVGLIFFVPGMEETLRVNGTGSVVLDDEVLEAVAIAGKLPKVAVVVETHEVFIHCGKAIRRSSLWDPAGWPDTSALPTAACMMVSHAKVPGDEGGLKTQVMLEEAYKTTLWNT